MSIYRTLVNPRFGPLFWTQFFGALNDNFFKTALVVLISYHGVSVWGLPPEQVVALASGIFILPFFLFSGISGTISDSFEKAHIARFTKWFEVVIMFVACFGFSTHSFGFLMAALFFMGLHSTIFGPVKYSIIPELIEPKELTAGNALVETGTFIAILVGTVLGGTAAALDDPTPVLAFGLIGVAVIGVFTSYKIPKVGALEPHRPIPRNPFHGIFKLHGIIRRDRTVFNSCIGISWFWFVGAVILSILPVMTKNTLHASEGVVSIFLALFTIGVALGSVICERLSYEKVELGLVPIGSLGMSLFMFDWAQVLIRFSQNPVIIALSPDSLVSIRDFFLLTDSWRISFDLFMVALFGGLYTVPLYTLIQERSERKIRSRIVAANNIMNSAFMVVSAVLLMACYQFKRSFTEILILFSTLNIIVSFYIYFKVPEFTLRLLSYILARCIYRIDITGHHHIPKEGPALLICNHVSFIDWLVIMAMVKRPVRFVIYYKYAQIFGLRYLFHHAGGIPIAARSEDSQIFTKAFQLVSQDLKDGKVICIFPEGGITRDGKLQAFKKGVEHIIKADPVPVIPMALGNLWGSIFSFRHGYPFYSLPRDIWEPVTLKINEPILAKDVTAAHLERVVREMAAK